MRAIPFLGHNAGVYNQVTNTITCMPSSCLHEVAHRLDDEAGFLMAASRDKEFRDVVGEIDVSYEEAYAMIFAASGGREELMPEQMRKFYDWSDINWMVYSVHDK